MSQNSSPIERSLAPKNSSKTENGFAGKFQGRSNPFENVDRLTSKDCKNRRRLFGFSSSFALRDFLGHGNQSGNVCRQRFVQKFHVMCSAPLFGTGDNDQEAGVPRTHIGHVNLERIGRPFTIEFREKRVDFAMPSITDIPISFESQNQILAASAEVHLGSCSGSR